MDLVGLISGIEKIAGITDTTKQKQNSLNVSDVWHVWDMLVAKYDTIQVMNVLINFAQDQDLIVITKGALIQIENGAAKLQDLMLDYAIPLPPRPPQSAKSTINLEVLTDRYIFNRIYTLLKQLIPLIASAFNNSGSPVPIKFFKDHMLIMMELVDNLSIYGEAKGYINPIPMYKPLS